MSHVGLPLCIHHRISYAVHVSEQTDHESVLANAVCVHRLPRENSKCVLLAQMTSMFHLHYCKFACPFGKHVLQQLPADSINCFTKWLCL